MKRIRWVAGLSVAVLIAACRMAGGEEVSNVVDEVVAVVENRPILRSDVNRAAMPVYRQLMESYGGRELEEKMKAAFNDVLSTLVDRHVILSIYTNAQQRALDAYVDDQLDQVVRAQFKGDRTAFLTALAEQKMPLDTWRLEKKQQALVSSIVREEITGKIMVSPVAISQRYETDRDRFKTPPAVKLRMIAISRGSNDEENAQKKKLAGELRDKAVRGEDFAELAGKFSEQAAESDGDCGWQEYKDIKGDLLAGITNLAAKGISEVLEAGGSYYIFRLEDVRPEGVVPFDQVRAVIEQQLAVEEFTRLYDAWIARLKKRVYVKVIMEGESIQR